jgi:hypothetical protein
MLISVHISFCFSSNVGSSFSGNVARIEVTNSCTFGARGPIFGPRAPKVQELVTSMRATLPEKEDPTFEEKQKEVFYFTIFSTIFSITCSQREVSSANVARKLAYISY